ncbi:MAG: DUF5329 family protein [Gammaproteobacteria bacterium]|nr:DUF5329 family protein [Gammaproteobacteria bacterium]
MNWLVLLSFSLFPLFSLGRVDSMNDEVDFLISSVGKDGCSFIRNGKKYTRRDAQTHLKSKRRRNAHLIGSTEEFIDKIASKSATSGKPYLISCKGENQQDAGEWLTALLAQRRKL